MYVYIGTQTPHSHVHTHTTGFRVISRDLFQLET